MNNIYIYLLLGVFLYFIFTRVLENFLVEQENFDPSLVPVSSIVTLAKVAQKLVNGNGTLTNPGNLQIGASTSSPGNLTVTGNSVVNGTTTLNGWVGGSNITTSGPRAQFTMNPVSPTIENHMVDNPKAFAWWNPDGTSTNLWSRPANKDVFTINKDGNTTVGGTLGVGGTTTSIGLLTANGGVQTSTLNVGAMTNLTDLKATGNIILSTNSAANGVSIGTDTLPEGAQGLRVKGKSMLMGDIQIGNKAKLYSGGDPFANDGWVRLMKADGSAAYSGSSTEGFAANNLYSQNDTIVNGNLTVRGVTKTHLTVIETAWDDNAFLNAMAPYFKKSDPDGTMIGFMLTSGGINGNIRVQYGIKVGDRILRAYHGWWDGHDCGGGCASNAAYNDAWRRNIP